MPIGTPTVLFESYSGSLFTTGADAPAGSLTVIWISASATPASTLTDSAGNVYSLAVSKSFSGSAPFSAIYYASNTTNDWPNGGTITISPGPFAAIAVTLTGANGGLDVTPTGTSNTGSPTLSSGALAQAIEIVFGSVNNDGNFGTPSGFTETSPFTALATAQNTQGMDFAYSITSATTAITYAPNWSGGAVQGGMAIASFKATPSASAIAVWPYRM